MGANFDAVADFVLCPMLAIARKIEMVGGECRKSNWGKIMFLEVHENILDRRNR